MRSITPPASAPPSFRAWLADQIARRPAVPVAAALMTGIALHDSAPVHPWYWLGLAVVCASAAGCYRQRAVLSSAFLMLAILIAGVAVAQLSKYRFVSDHIFHFSTEQPRLAQLELYIERQPRILADPFAVGRALPPKQVCVARVTRVLTWNGWVESDGGILVQIDQPHPRLAIHQTVRVLGMLQRPSPAMNPGQFNWADYYREQRVLCSIGIDHADNISIITRDAPSVLTKLRSGVRHLLAAGFPEAVSLDHALLGALLLGDHDPELRDVQEQFRKTGTSHHLAISGMHIAVLGAVVLAVCHLLRLSPRAAMWVSTLFVVLYGVVALPSPPVIRSVLLCVIFSIGIVSRRSVDAIQLLAISVIAMLLYHPLDLFNAGFQLSFGTVLGLILFTEPLARFIWRDDPDIEVLRSFHKLSPRQLARDQFKRKARTILAAAVVAWVVSLPLIAYHFEQLNPWAIPGSILLAPFVFVALVGGFLKVVLTLLFPAAAPAWAVMATLPMEAMRDIVGVLAWLPGSDVPLPAPPLWIVVAFYIVLVIPLLPITTTSLRRSVRACCTAAGVGLLVAPFVFGFRALDAVSPRADELSITLLSVGAGQCAVIAPPRGKLVLIDCGSATLRDPLRKCIAPFVRHLGRWSVGRVILSHGDFDHISAAAEVVEAYGVNEVMTSAHFARLSAGNPPAEGLLRFLESTDRTVLELIPGNRINLGGGAMIDVLWPPRDSDLSSNDSGLVLRLTFAGRSVLLPADIQAAAQMLLLEAPDQLKADVLIAPHHGSAEKTTAAFLQAVDAQIVISSNDRTLSGKQVDFEALTAGRVLHRTNRQGSVTLHMSRAGELTVTTFESVR